MKQFSLGRHVALFLPVIVAACSSIDRSTEPSARPVWASSGRDGIRVGWPRDLHPGDRP
jgi:hypothetical protein